MAQSKRCTHGENCCINIIVRSELGKRVEGKESDEYPPIWKAATSAVTRGHIKEIRLAADYKGKALQSLIQTDKTKQFTLIMSGYHSLTHSNDFGL